MDAKLAGRMADYWAGMWGANWADPTVVALAEMRAAMMAVRTAG